MGFLRTAIYVVILGVVYKQGVRFLTKKLPQAGGGFAAPGWRKIADVFKRYVDDGDEKGGIFTVYHKGKLVVEFWGGYANEEAKVKWAKDTLGMYCSVAKATGAICLAKLVDRGLLEYDKPVVEYWPEFGQNGKETVTVKQLLSHQAGLAIIEEKFPMFDILHDPEKIGRILAAQKPTWTPGSNHGYHGVTMGLLMDQLMRRIDPQRRSLSQFFQEEIAEAFDIDFHIGLPKAENYRVAHLYPVDLLSLGTLLARQYWNLLYTYATSPNSLLVRSIQNPPEMNDDLENNPAYREIPTASSHGYGTGESVAKLMGILANGGEHNGQFLLSEGTIHRLAQTDVSGSDALMQRNISYGPGVVVRQGSHGGSIFGHFGAGGQIGFADPANRLGWSYLTTHHSIYALGDSPKTLELERVMYECLREYVK